MAKEVDTKVVEMQFNNKQFEKNVSESLTTIEKLKKALTFEGIKNGLESISFAAKKVTLAPIENAAKSLSHQFKLTEVAAITAVANITNSAVNAAKRITKEFTVKPISDGFQEFELKMGSIQTIIAGTGESLETVNRLLNELNIYSDKTIYSFKDMTSNIGKFTNAGVKLEPAVKAIQGIANVAAVSGAKTEEASRAMYNFSQALSAGAVKLIDWKSIENANMATVEFKQTLIDTAVAMGTLVRDGDSYLSTTTDLQGKTSNAFNATKSFNDSLSHQWMTTEVLTQALEIYSQDIRTMTDAEKAAYETKLRGLGFTDEQIIKYEELGKKAFDAAQDVKTFTMMMDTLKESVGSGWAATWELIIGDFEEGKKLWTNLTNFFSGIIDVYSNTRNEILGTALNKNFKDIANIFSSMRKTFQQIVEPIRETGKAFKELDDVVDRVIMGAYGNLDARWSKLTEEGYDWAQVQNEVNKRLGVTKRYTESTAQATEAYSTAIESTSSAIEDQLEYYSTLNFEQLRSLGLFPEQARAIVQLTQLSEKLGIPVRELLDNLDELDGRWILIESFKNIGKTLITVFNAVRQAYVEVFKPLSNAEYGEKLFDIIAMFHKLTRQILDFVSSGERVQAITSVFKGLFSVIKLFRDIIGGALTVALRILNGVLANFGMTATDLAGAIGEIVYKIATFIDEHVDIERVLGAIVNLLTESVKMVIEWIDAIKKIPAVANLLTNFEKIFNSVASDFSEYLSTGINVITEFIKRCKELKGFSFGNLKTAFSDFFTNVIGHFVNFKNGFTNLKTVVKGFSDSFNNAINEKVETPLGNAARAVQSFGLKLKSIFGTIAKGIRDNVGLGEILTMISGGLLVAVSREVTSFIDEMKENVKSLFEVAKALSGVLKAISGAIGAFALSFKANAFVKIAAALLLVATSVWILAELDTKKMLIATAAIAVLGALMAATIALVMKIGSDRNTTKAIKNAVRITTILTGLIVGATLMMASFVALALVQQKMDPDQIAITFSTMFGLISMITLLAAGLLALSANANQRAFDQGAQTILAITASIAIMVFCIQKLSEIPETELQRSLLALYGAVSLLILLGTAMLSFSSIAPGMLISAALIVSLSASLLPMAIALNMLKNLEFKNVEDVLSGLSTIFKWYAIIIASSMLAGPNAASAGLMIAAISSSLLLIAVGIRALAAIKPEMIEQCKKTLLGVSAVISMFIAISHFAGRYAARAGLMILGITAAIALLPAIAVILGHIPMARLRKATLAMATIVAVFALVVKASTFASGIDAKAIKAMGLSIGVMLIAVGALSLIPKEQLWNAVAAVGVISLIFAALMTITRFSGTTRNWKVIAALGASVAAIMAIFVVLASINPKNVEDNANAFAKVLISFGVVFAGLLVLSKTANALNTKNVLAIMLVTSLVSLLVSTILVMMSKMNTQNAVKNAFAISILLKAFSSVIYTIAKIDYSGVTSRLESMYKMTLLVGIITVAMAAVLWGMSALGVKDAMQNATGLGILMLAFSSSMFIISNMKDTANGTKRLMPVLLGITAGLGTILVVMGKFGDTSVISQNALGLSLVMEAFAAAMLIISLMKDTADGTKRLMPVLLGITAGLGTILVGMSIFGDASDAVKNAEALSIAMIAFSASMLIISLMKDVAAGVIGTIAVMIPIILSIGSCLAAIAAFSDSSDDALRNALALSLVMVAFSAAMVALSLIKPHLDGATIGAIGIMLVVTAGIGALLAWLGSIQPGNALENSKALSLALTSFTTNLIILSVLCKIMTTIPIAAAAKAAASIVVFMAILAAGLTGMYYLFSLFNKDTIANGIETLTMIFEGLGHAIGSLIGGLGAGVMQTIASGIDAIIEPMTRLIATVNGVDNKSAEGAHHLADALLTLCQASLLDGLAKFMSFITGHGSIDSFGDAIAVLGKGLVSYVDSISGVSNWDVINPSLEATEKLIDIANKVPNSGGLFGLIVGDNDIDTFGANIAAFAAGLVAYANIVSGVDPDVGPVTWDGCSAAYKYVNDIIEVAHTIPNNGGLFGAIIGNNDIKEFGLKLADFGVSLANYANAVADADSWTGIPKTVEYAASLVEVAKIVDAADVDAYDISAFSEAMLTFGTDLMAYWGNVKGIDATSIPNSAKGIVSLTNALRLLPTESDYKNAVSLSDLGTALKDFAPDLLVYYQVLSSVDENKLKTINDAIAALAITISTLNEFSYDGVNSFIRSLDIISETIKSMPSSTAYEEAGKYIVIGFANGITDNTYIAINAAKSMANRALIATKDILQVHSPSREMEEIGKFVAIGFAIGIEANSERPKKAIEKLMSSSLAEIAIKSKNIAESASRYLTKTLSNGISAFTRALANTSIENVAKTMDYGADAMKAYIKQYVKFTNSVKDNDIAIQNASKSVKDYVENLYKQSSQYEEDKKKLEEDKKKLEELKKERENAAKSQTVTKAANTATKSLDELSTSAINTEEICNTAMSGIADSATNAYNTFSSGITSIKKKFTGSIIDWIKNSGIDFNTLNTKLKEYAQKAGININAITHQYGSLTDALFSGYSGFQDLLDGNGLINTDTLFGNNSTNEIVENIGNITDAATSATTDISTTGRTLEQIDKDIAETTAKIAQDEENMKQHTKDTYTTLRETIINNMKDSTDFLKQNFDSQIKIFDEFKSRVLSYDPFAAISDSESISKKDMLNRIESRMQEYAEYERLLAQADARNISANLLNYLKSLGLSGKEVLKTVLSMTDVELKNLGEYYDALLKKETPDMLGALQSQLDGIKKWKNDIKTLTNLGLAQGVIDELKEKGPDAQAEIDAFLGMTADEIDKYNKLYEQKLHEDFLSGMESWSKNVAIQSNYATALETLAKKGLKPELIEELRAQGAEAGSAVVSGLLTATDKDIKSINEQYDKANKEINKSADSIIATSAYAESESKKNTDKASKNAKKASKLASSSADMVLLGLKVVEAAANNEALVEESVENANKLNKDVTNDISKTNNTINNSDNYAPDNNTVKEVHTKWGTLYTTVDKDAEQFNNEVSHVTNEVKNTVKDMKKLVSSEADNIDISFGLRKQIPNLKADFNNIINELINGSSQVYGDGLISVMQIYTDKLKENVKSIKETVSSAITSSLELLNIDMSTGIKLFEEYQDSTKSETDKSKTKKTDMLHNMYSQLNGYKKWKADLAALSKTDIAPGLLDELRALGISGAETVHEFVKMTTAELHEANDMYAESVKASGTELLENFTNKLTDQKLWGEKLQKLYKMGFSSDMIKYFAEAGMDASDATIDAIFSMTPADQEKLKEKWKEAATLPKEVSESIANTYQEAFKSDFLNPDKWVEIQEGFKNLGIDFGEALTTGLWEGMKKMIEEDPDKFTNILLNSTPDNIFANLSPYYSDWVNKQNNSKKSSFNAGGNKTDSGKTSHPYPVSSDSDDRLLSSTMQKTMSILSMNTTWTNLNAVAQLAASINTNNDKILTELKSLGITITDGYNSIANKEVSIYVDSKKLASSISRPMDTELGKMTYRRR